MNRHDVEKHGTIMVYTGVGEPTVANVLPFHGGSAGCVRSDVGMLGPDDLQRIHDIRSMLHDYSETDLQQMISIGLRAMVELKARRNKTITPDEVYEACLPITRW